MLRIAVTGGIACGKSLAGSFIAAANVSVCDSDDVAHGFLNAGSSVCRELIEVFGAQVEDSTGSIDRAALADIVFSDAENLARLNAIVHPPVKNAWLAWLDSLDNEMTAAVVIVPLLYEIGDEDNWDAVLCIGAPEIRQRTWMGERGLTEAQIDVRLGAQMSVVEKMKRADCVVYNIGTKELLKEQTLRALQQVVEK